MQTSVEKEGFESVLYTGDGNKDKIMIVVSGSNGGMLLTKMLAKFYSKQGIPALALAMFGTKQTGANLSEIPLEYVERAISWLKNLGYHKMGIDGTSKGSEYAMLSAIHFHELSCVILRVPSYFVSEGLSSGKGKGPIGKSCWAYKNVGFPYAEYKAKIFDIKKQIMIHKEFNILAFNVGKTVTEEALIPVEKIEAPILMLSTEADEVWPSAFSGDYLEKRLRDNEYGFTVKHIKYQYISHAMIPRGIFILKCIFKSERQFAKKCKAERRDMNWQCLTWVYEIWK